ncbi:trypsin CFT-1-like [Leptidea sinapis]|uniref:trypsin CFT-1-like n=1 Tax=Leptidea sinapis TaxID=189913 RepID=UPI002126A559|nr:trypsin CFT-1-like [Leptidea sinapis]
MRSVCILVAICFASVAAVPAADISGRLAGGSLATVNQYPFIASMLYSRNGVSYVQSCAGSIITNRAILSSASCYFGDANNNWRIKVGSSYANSGGIIHYINSIFINAAYNSFTRDGDMAIVRSNSVFTYTAAVNFVRIASPTYNLPDQSAVWALGWGRTSPSGAASEQLRYTQIWTVNTNVCRNIYRGVGFTVTDNMICTGWLNNGGRGQCDGDNGGPLIHNTAAAGLALVGVFSWGQCGSPVYPDINTRVSRYAQWIANNA